MVAISGIAVAYLFYFNKPFPAAVPERNKLEHFFFNGWDFDLLYHTMIVVPVVVLSRIDKNDFIDKAYTGLTSLMRALHKLLSATQNGRMRWYATVLAIGAIITITIILYL